MSEKKGAGKAGIGAVAVFLATAVVMQWEGLSLTTYADPVKIPTVCYGETQKRYVLQERFSEPECKKILEESLQKHAAEVSKCMKVPVTYYEAAAILSWSYNVGTGAACGSTLMRLLNEGKPAKVWCQELSKWVYAKGKVLRGLVNRRGAELELCTTGVVDTGTLK